jgi:hypothetical protein
MWHSLWAMGLTALTCLPSMGAEIGATFSQLSGSTWSVDLSITNDGTPAEITGFTVYFSEALFADLMVDASPAVWDSIAIQPDVALASAGFLDSLLFDPSAPLTLGQTQAGFRVQFTYLDSGSPSMLPYDIVDGAFQVVAAGVTVPLTSPVPEPSALLLASVGLAIVSGAVARTRRCSVVLNH